MRRIALRLQLFPISPIWISKPRPIRRETSLDRFRARYGMINLSRLRQKVEENLVAFSQVRS